MKKIIFRRPDGGISVIHPNINTHPEPEQITEEEAFERAKQHIPQDATDVHFVDAADIPKDRSKRNQWEIKDKKIHIKDKSGS